MAGIYIHIPFCKQACHYCDFHFSTSLKKKAEMLWALNQELKLRKDELNGKRVETIYFGGGTPSVLEQDEIKALIDSVYSNYDVIEVPEITLEANPDDLSEHRIIKLHQTRVNRLSIGVQSFFDDDLKKKSSREFEDFEEESVAKRTKSAKTRKFFPLKYLIY